MAMESGPFSQTEPNEDSKITIQDLGKEFVLFAHVTAVPGSPEPEKVHLYREMYQDDPHKDLLAGGKDADLLREKGGRGFPHMLFLDASGATISEFMGPRTLAGIQHAGQRAQKYLNLKKKVDGGDDSKRYDLLLTEIRMGRHSLIEAKAKVRQLDGLSDKQISRLDSAILNLEVFEEVQKLNSEKAVLDLGKRFWGYYNAGKQPTADDAHRIFFGLIMEYGQQKQKPAALRAALDVLEKTLAGQPRFEEDLKAARQALEEMEKAQAGG